MQRVYELVVFLKPVLTEEEIKNTVGKVKAYITESKGNILEEKQPEKQKTNFEMKGYRDAFHYFVRYEAGPETALNLNEKLRITEEIIRFMISRFVVHKHKVKKRKPKKEAVATESAAAAAPAPAPAPKPAAEETATETGTQEA